MFCHGIPWPTDEIFLYLGRIVLVKRKRYFGAMDGNSSDVVFSMIRGMLIRFIILQFPLSSTFRSSFIKFGVHL